MKYTQIFGRLGNKTNDIKSFKTFLNVECDTIVEPFCGSCAVSKYMKKKNNNLNVHINDLDKELFILMTNIDEYIEFIKKIRNEHAPYLEEHNEDINYSKAWKEYVQSLDNKFARIYSDSNFVRGYMYKAPKKINCDPFDIEFFNTSKITNLNYIYIFEQYINDPNALLFLDPPYMFSDNSSYVPQLDEKDMSQIMIDILEFLKVCKCKVLFIINNLAIIRYLFKDFIKDNYEKIYQISKKKSNHLIIANY